VKILGIDYGEKRIGLAISDESLTLARELEILSPKEFWDSLAQLILSHAIEKIVLGWPLNMDGGETNKTREVAIFKMKVEDETGLPVEVIDERLSSQMAEHISGSIRLRPSFAKATAGKQGFGGPRSKNKSKSAEKYLDSLAAQILLQNYLDKTKNNE
jgi:putative Holliday junction resolvase